MNIKAILEADAQKYGSKPALIYGEKTVPFSQLKEQVGKLANALRELGVGKGDKIGVYLPNCPEYVYSYLAGFCLGAVVVPLDFMLKSEELISCLGHSEAKVLIANVKNDISFDELKIHVPALEQIVVCSGESTSVGAVSYEEIMSKAKAELPTAEMSETDPALIMYTSGTTGRPKGIQLNYKHLGGSPEAMKYFVNMSARDLKLCAIPFSHIGGFIYIQNCVFFGITLVMMDRFNPIEFLKNVEQYKVTCFHIVPAMYTALLTLKNIEKFNLSSLRWVVVFGAPSSPEILERFHQYCPNAQLLNGWGMTETCPPNTVTPLGSKNIASIGKPAPHCEIKILDEKDKELPAGQIGEIVIRGWIVMDGYYKDPEVTAEVKKNGWLYTGDLGRFDSEGFLYIMGRKKEMIKVAGQIVYAPEVEAVLAKHAAVIETAVIGVPDSLRGEAIKAYVVVRDDVKVSVEDLRYFARQHLANFKLPQSIQICPSLPKNRTGKIDKELLKQEALT